MLCCPPSPKGWDTPVPSPASPPLLSQEGCLSTQCSLEMENTGMQNSNVTLTLGVRTWHKALHPCPAKLQHTP